MIAGKQTRRLAALLLAAGPVALAGCSAGGPPAARTPPTAAATVGGHAEDDVAAERAKLPPDDRAAVDAQEWCAINTTERLGSMGPPVKVMVKDQPVYLCCGGCRKEALSEPDKTLTAVADLKTKAKAGAVKN